MEGKAGGLQRRKVIQSPMYYKEPDPFGIAQDFECFTRGIIPLRNAFADPFLPIAPARPWPWIGKDRFK
jgi:hypothetical protein